MMTWGEVLEMVAQSNRRWPQASHQFEVGDCTLWIEQDRFFEDESTWEILIRVESAEFGAFLSCCRTLSENAAFAIPKVRQTTTTRQKPGVLGQALLNVVVAGWEDKLDVGIVVVQQPYKNGAPLNPIGFSTNTGLQIAQFLEHVKTSLQSPAGVFLAHQKQGFLLSDMGQFDLFYGYLWSAMRAGYSKEQCLDGAMINLNEIERRKQSGNALRDTIDTVFKHCGARLDKGN